MKPLGKEFKQLIYDLMNGVLDLQNHPVRESSIVTNEFEEDRYCGVMYQEAFDARQRLYQKLGTDDDVDVEFIINSYSDMTYKLCMDMFDCGASDSEKSLDDADSSFLFAHVWISKACNRICRRLEKGDDEDVTVIIANYSNIMHYLGMKMYDYGCYFANRLN